MRCTVCHLLGLAAAARALSSHSPQDLYASPKYSIELGDWDVAVNNATAEALLAEASGPSAAEGLVPRDRAQGHRRSAATSQRTRLMRSATGQAFLCTVPPIPSRGGKTPAEVRAELTALWTDDERKKREDDRARRKEDGLRKGLELLEPMRNLCIFTKMGWFTYSFCYGTGEIRQFHAVLVQGHNHPHEDPNYDVYTLGYHVSHASHPYRQIEGAPETPPAAAAGELAEYGRSLGGKGGFGLSEVLREESLGGLAAASAAIEIDVEEKHYITQRWEGGTICDMTGKPRSVEVQFHCSTAGPDSIAFLREIAICEYLVVIHTPRLCAEPLFLGGGASREGGAEKTETISCRPVVEEAIVQRMRAQREAEARAAPSLESSVEESPQQQATVQEQEVYEAPKLTDDTKAYLDSRSDAGEQPQAGTKELGSLQLVYNAQTGELYFTDPADAETAASEGAAGTPTPSEDEGEAAAHDAIQDLGRVLRDSLESLLKDLKEVNQAAREDEQPAAGQQQPQQASLQDVLAKLAQAADQQGGQAGADGQPQQRPAAGGQPQQGAGGRTVPNRKRPQPFPAAQVNLNRQGGAPAALALLQAAQRGQLQNVAAGQQVGRAGASAEHARLASLYGKAFDEEEGEPKEKRRDRQEL